MSITQQALGIGATSPYPVSFDGSGTLFWITLFALILISSLCLMLGGTLSRHLFEDRHSGHNAVSALRSFVLASCIVSTMNFVPQIIYMICYSEASPGALKAIMMGWRISASLSIFPAVFWIGTFKVWYPDLVLKLQSEVAYVWQDNRLAQLKRFGWVVCLSAILALSVTVGVAFR